MNPVKYIKRVVDFVGCKVEDWVICNNTRKVGLVSCVVVAAFVVAVIL